MSDLEGPTPTKAYLITVRIVNECDTVVVAHNAADARRRFRSGEGEDTLEFNGRDYRIGGTRVRRYPDGDGEQKN